VTGPTTDTLRTAAQYFALDCAPLCDSDHDDQIATW
jgi:hypothetical protein